jgi:hypothetical protein
MPWIIKRARVYWHIHEINPVLIKIPATETFKIFIYKIVVLKKLKVVLLFPEILRK